MNTLKTKLHYYCFNTDTPEGAKAWTELKEKLAPIAARKMHSHSGGDQPLTHRNETQETELDPSFLFSNQWNETESAGNRRLFDWYQQYRLSGKNWKQGHYLDITPEMDHIRAHTLTCGYCGKYVREGEPHGWHCAQCLGSEYIKPTDLKMLRLEPVSAKRDYRELTDTERAEILPKYNEAQGLGLVSREAAAKSKARQKIARLVPDAEAKAAQDIANAKTETAAYTWLLDHGVNILDNVIFYDHTRRFCFGWRTPLTATEKSALLDVLCECHFDYDIKGA